MTHTAEGVAATKALRTGSDVVPRGAARIRGDYPQVAMRARVEEART